MAFMCEVEEEKYGKAVQCNSNWRKESHSFHCKKRNDFMR
jgi:hypothetical protein